MSIFLLLFIAPTFIFLPFFANADLLLNRNNDLTEFFWPIFYYIKQNILFNHLVPSMNTMWFAGTPLLPDPQNPIWYFPNIIFLLLTVDSTILFSLFIHTLFGALGAYIVSRRVAQFSKFTSLFMSAIYISSPIYFSYLEAGHWGLAISWDWIPYLLLSTHMLTTRPRKVAIILFAFSASSIYFNHVPTATILGFAILIYWLYKKAFIYPLIASLLTLILVSPALILQLTWGQDTTRQLLLSRPEMFPTWLGEKEFIKSIFFFNPETEKTITLGIVPGILVLIGFIRLKLKSKILVGLSIFSIALISLNNASPVSPLIQSINYFVLLRVMTRVWILVFFICLFCIGVALERLGPRIAYFLGVLAIVESIIIGYSYYLKPVHQREDIPEEIYKVFQEDWDSYRILCLSRCVPQKESAKRNLQLVEGYGTLQSLSYSLKIQKALNTKWDKYSLSIPPFDVYLYQDIQPNAELLAKSFSTKYVISKYPLTDQDFKFIKRSGSYLLYLDSKYSHK